jgi:unsaturated rhamnogalacturonyl hydrolase
LVLRWEGVNESPGPARLRICLLDTREASTPVEVGLLGTQRVLGRFDLQWMAEFQIAEISLNAEDVADVLRQGVWLRQTDGESPVWILSDSGSGPQVPDALRPHLLFESSLADPMNEFFLRLDSLACIQAFGWMSGCVLDGLHDLSLLPKYQHLKRSLHDHLELRFKPDGRIVYENLRGEAVDNRMSGVSSSLPFAALALHRQDHPALQVVLDFWRERGREDSDGCIIDRDATNSEGCYAVGYPMAVIALQRQDVGLAQNALRQVLIRQQRLFDGDSFFRNHAIKADGQVSKGDRNWCRGIAWQLLGLCRTIAVLDGFIDVRVAQEEATRLAKWVVPYQLPDGLWSVFVDEPHLRPDTSGSAGIAAALAIGFKHGWLDKSMHRAAVKCLAGLKPHLTPDGFLGGASQSNKGGPRLQRSNYRVIYQMGMGLLAQLIAALDD